MQVIIRNWWTQASFRLYVIASLFNKVENVSFQRTLHRLKPPPSTFYHIALTFRASQSQRQHTFRFIKWETHVIGVTLFLGLKTETLAAWSLYGDQTCLFCCYRKALCVKTSHLDNMSSEHLRQTRCLFMWRCVFMSVDRCLILQS